MTGRIVQDDPRPADELFMARCDTLGLAAWRCEENGTVLCEPEEPGTIRAWLASPWLRRRVEEVARHGADQDRPQITEIFAGGWLIPIAQPQGARRVGVTVVLALGEAAVEAREFAEVCAAAGVPTDEARTQLLPFLRYGRSDLEQLAAMLRWSHEDLVQAQQDRAVINEFSEKLLQSYEETNLLFRLARLMNCATSPRQSMEATCCQLHQILPFQWVAMKFNSDGVGSELAGGLMLAGDLPCPREAFDRLAVELLARWTADNWTRVLTVDRSELAALVGSEVVADPITHDGRVVGALLAGNKMGPDREVSSVETQFLDASADFMGVFHENIERYTEQRTLFLGTLGALTASIDAKDRYTCGHSERVALLGSRLAGAMNLDDKRVEQVRIAGVVHDVGKIGVPEAVLCKAGRLTDEEFEQIKRHPVIGYEILKDIPPLTDMLPGVLYHHERFDGLGYPDRLSGADIPLYGRILACADTFDAMSSTRSYRPAMPREKVLDEFRRCAGTQFDPALAELFVTLDFAEYDEMVARHHVLSGFAA
ncbi:MAG: HD domain-containing phosphohydrolase [Phycisphaeraceae bacterium]